MLVILSHPVFQLYVQSVCYSVDVIEVANDLCGDCDLVIIKPMLFQQVDIRLVDVARAKRQFNGISAKGLITCRKLALAEIKNKFFNLLRGVGLHTEVTCMGQRSVETVICIADDRRKHLFLSTRQSIFVLHNGDVEFHR